METPHVSGHRLAGLLDADRLAGRRPYYLTLAAALRELIAGGGLALRVRLPAERDLAAALGVSRTTVTAAYDALRERGYVDSRQGAGSWTTLPSHHSERPERHVWPGAAIGEATVDFAAAALPAPSVLDEAAHAALAELPRYTSGHGYHLAGIEPLREAVAAGYTARGVATTPDQILITSGALHAIDLVAQLLARPGDAVVTESPTYYNAIEVLRNRGLRVAGVAHAGGRADVDLMATALRQTSARLGYVIADFHNPTGALLGASGRAELVAATRSGGAHLIVDETYVELPIDDVVVPAPVCAYDTDGRVISIGAASKLYWGGLRIGWVRAAASIVAKLVALRAGIDVASPVLDQLVVVELEKRGTGVRAERRAQLARRRDALLGAIERYLPELRYTSPPGGLSLWGELPAPVGGALADAAASHGVLLTPGPSFGVDGALERFVRLPLSPEPAAIDAGVEALAAAYASLDSGAARRLPPVRI